MFSVVRDRQKVWPYCKECGCRLKIDRRSNYGLLFLAHFPHDFFTQKDARGHLCNTAKWAFNIQEHEIAHIGV